MPISEQEKIVLVGVLKNKRDLDILFNEKWYRIPVKRCPKSHFKYLAFYQPALFGKEGKCIKYYARVKNRQALKRFQLLPDEPDNKKANDDYFKIGVEKIKKLPCPIKNIIPRRVCFGFTTLAKLFKSKNILQLYSVADTEKIIKKALRSLGIRNKPQHYVIKNPKERYRLDFAVFCREGNIAIECDNLKAHSSKVQKQKDKAKNRFLRQHGWKVERLKEAKIILDLNFCIKKIENTIAGLGGLIS